MDSLNEKIFGKIEPEPNKETYTEVYHDFRTSYDKQNPAISKIVKEKLAKEHAIDIQKSRKSRFESKHIVVTSHRSD